MADSSNDSDLSFPAATEDGPLYPPFPFPVSSDLTNDGRAVGTPVLLQGHIYNYRNDPVPNALVEIWQTDSKGYYKHPRVMGPDALDSFWNITPDDLDPNFLYFSSVRTNSEGHYAFQTILPRWYHVFGTDRAAHIHVKVRSEQNGVFTTEIYFDGNDHDEIRNRDTVYSRHPGTSGLVVTLTQDKTTDGLVCTRDIRFY